MSKTNADNNTEAKKPSAKPSNKQDSAENLQDYLIENQAGVVAKLKMLAKNNTMITAMYNNGESSMSTGIIQVLRDMDLVALDIGPTESLNEQLLKAGRIVFKAELDGVDAQFTASSITRAKLKGEPVFAIPIPDSMLWVQRREYFRVRIPLGAPAYCEIMQADGSYRKYKVYDICSGGLSLHDEFEDLEVDNGIALSACKLELPEQGHGQVNLEVCNLIPMKIGDKPAGRRVGCRFINLGMSFAATIQRYINAIEAARRRMDD